MDILGIGLTELLFIIIIALIVLGPNDMIKAGRTLGRFLRRLVTSPTWKAVQQTSRDLRYLPNKLMRDAGMEEDVEEIKQIGRDLNKEAAMLRSLGSPLRDAGNEISQEVNQAAQGLSAWTTPPEAAPPEDAAREAALRLDTPGTTPLPPTQSTTGPVDIYPAAPDSDPKQPPANPTPS